MLYVCDVPQVCYLPMPDSSVANVVLWGSSEVCNENDMTCARVVSAVLGLL